jgi:hypothetical protein
MNRQLKKNEKSAIYAAVGLLVLIILWLVLINPARNGIKELKKSIQDERNALKRARELKLQYLSLESDLKQYLDIINLRNVREKDFTLKQCIADIENKLNFKSSIQRPEITKKLGAEYIRTTIEYTYNQKSLPEIIEFLYEIEEPSKAIAITNFELKPSLDGEKFDIRRVSLAAVTKK